MQKQLMAKTNPNASSNPHKNNEQHHPGIPDAPNNTQQLYKFRQCIDGGGESRMATYLVLGNSNSEWDLARPKA